MPTRSLFLTMKAIPIKGNPILNLFSDKSPSIVYFGDKMLIVQKEKKSTKIKKN